MISFFKKTWLFSKAGMMAVLLIGFVSLSASASPALKGQRVAAAPAEMWKAFFSPQTSKIQVVEFFWYGCSHCQELEPGLSKWVKDNSNKVQFVRIPAALGSWGEDAKIYLALVGAGLKDEQNGIIFDFYAKRAASKGARPNLDDVIVVAKKIGLEEKKIRDAYGSFDTSNKLRVAKEILKFYKIDGVPALLVNGNYMTGAAYVSSPKGILADLTLAVGNQK